MPDSPRPRRQRARLLGLALIGYGLIGIVLFVVVGLAVSRPLDRAQALGASVEEQRLSVIATLEQAQTTIRQMGEGVERMDVSLADARAATDRASAISHSVAFSMFQLRDQMSLTVFGLQPFIGLASGFDASGQQLDLLGADLSTIGASLQTNRADVLTTAENMELLADSVAELTATVRDGPAVDISTTTLDAIRLAVYAICGWLILFAVGCLLAGVYLFRLGRHHVVAETDPGD
ncbi:MAG: hypothetical protein ABI797_03255 [Chloroflexota bacterium]